MLTLRNRLTERWAKQEEQVVHLGASTIPSAYILPELLPAYRRRQPEIRFDIHQSDSQGVIDGLLRGSFEVGLVGFQGQEPSVEYIPFYRDSMVLITPVTPHFCRIRDRGGITLGEIVAESILLREQGAAARNVPRHILRRWASGKRICMSRPGSMTRNRLKIWWQAAWVSP